MKTIFKLLLLSLFITPLSVQCMDSDDDDSNSAVQGWVKNASNAFNKIGDTFVRLKTDLDNKLIKAKEAIQERYFADKEKLKADRVKKQDELLGAQFSLESVCSRLLEQEAKRNQRLANNQTTHNEDLAISQLKLQEQSKRDAIQKLKAEVLDLDDKINVAQKGLEDAQKGVADAIATSAKFIDEVTLGGQRAKEKENLEAIRAHTEAQAKKEADIVNYEKELKERSRQFDEKLKVDKERFDKILNNLGPILKKTSLATVAVIAGYFTIKKTVEIGGNYIESLIGKPRLIRESNMEFSLSNQLKYKLFGKQAKFAKLDNIIVNPELEKQLKNIALGAKKSADKKIPFVHVILQGRPGLGKTMFAKALAEYAGFNYLILSGADARQFKDEDALAELNKMFDRVENTYGRFVIFVDEADAMLPKRTPNLSEAKRNIVTTFLTRVEKQTSNKYLVVLATNHPEDLDEAVISRFGGEIVKFPLPGMSEREKIFTLYLNAYFKPKKISVDAEVIEHLSDLAQSMDGLTGRDIDGLVVKMLREVILNDQNSLTMPVAQGVIQRTIAGLNSINAMEVKPMAAAAA